MPLKAAHKGGKVNSVKVGFNLYMQINIKGSGHHYCTSLLCKRRVAWLLQKKTLDICANQNIITSMNVNSDNKSVLLERISQNGGRITTKEVNELGIHRQFLKQLADNGEIVQISRGIYQTPDSFEDELFNLQSEYTAGIFSYETSLFLFKLLERVPFEWTMTFKGNYHSEKLKEKGVTVKLSKPDFFEEGIVDVKTPGNHIVKAYCAERTLCEILRGKAGTDVQIISYAYKEYVKRKEKNLPLLMEFSKKFSVEQKVRSYIEVLV